MARKKVLIDTEERSINEIFKKDFKRISRKKLDSLNKNKLYEEYLKLYKFTEDVLKELDLEINRRNKVVDQKFELKNQLENKELEIENLKMEIEELKLSKGVTRVKNERGAGRHKVYSNEDIELIKRYREEGNSLREIAKKTEFSLGTIQKVVRKLNLDAIKECEIVSK